MDRLLARQSTLTYFCSLCFCLVILSIFTACSSLRNTRPTKNVLTVAFPRSIDDETDQPLSYSFEIKNFIWHPAGASSNSTYLYTRQETCLEGKSVSPPGEVSADNKIYLCFFINDPTPYTLRPPPIHTGTFPIARVVSVRGEQESHYLNEVSGFGIDLTEYSTGSQRPRVRRVELIRETAEGSIEITISDKNRLAGKFNVRDSIVSITGSFDCPFRYRR